MCGESFGRSRTGIVNGQRPEMFGLDVQKMSPGSRVAVALAVLVPVALSGMVLVFTPVWWIFTTYFWVAFPAFGILGSGLAGLSESRPARISGADLETELLEVLERRGEVSAAGVAAETSMSVAEADRRLDELAEGGHLEVRVRGGGIFYALWGAGGTLGIEDSERASYESRPQTSA